MQVPATDEVLIRREGRAGRITMNRPQALNALTLGMVHRIWDALLAWQDGPRRRARPARRRRRPGAVRRRRRARPLRQPRAGIDAGAHLLARRVPAQRADRPLPQALRRHPGRHRHGRRHRPLRPRARPHRHRALAARHARDRHRPDPGRGRHVAAGGCAGRRRRLPGADRRGDARRRRHLRPLLRRVHPLGQDRRSWWSGWSTPRAGRSAAPSARSPRMRGRRRWPSGAPTSTAPSAATASRPCWPRSRRCRASGRRRPPPRWRRNRPSP